MQTRSVGLLGAALFAAAAIATPTPADAASGTQPVVAIVEVATPWYAPAFLIRSKMRDTIPLYTALPGLAFKYFSVSDQGKFGGIYLWQTEAAARAWFNDAWFANVLHTRGTPASVRLFEVVRVRDMLPGGVRRDDHSDAAAILVTAPADGAWADEGATPGLLRRYDLRTGDGHRARMDLWSSGRAARGYYDEGRLAQLRATLGDVQVQVFATPILLPSSLLENRAARPS